IVPRIALVAETDGEGPAVTVIYGVKGDGFWIEKVNGVKLLNNTVTTANGSTADAVKVNDSSNILIKGNHLDQTHASSPKG
ncbi:hypothetical protein ACC698_38530, partial [Rhizobium johnstonii]